MLEIKLPKCLTEKERNIIRGYNESILSVLTEEERNRKIPRFLASVDNPTRGPRYRPFKTLGDIDTDTECFDQKLYKGLLDAVKENSFCNAAPTPEITLLYFNGAYAMAIHSLNHKNPELYYEEHYRNIWWTGEVDADWGNRIDVTMEHICACMVYRILEYEKNPRYDLLLQEIKHLIENSYFVEHNTLDCFKLTEMGEDTPHTPPTSADTNTDSVEESEEASDEAHCEVNNILNEKVFKNVTLLQFKEEGGLEKWTALVNESIKDIEDHTLTSKINNTMLAVMYYFSTGWKTRKGIFKKTPPTTDLVYFFISRCDMKTSLAGKSILNKLNKLFDKNDKAEIKETEEIVKVRKIINEILNKNT